MPPSAGSLDPGNRSYLPATDLPLLPEPSDGRAPSDVPERRLAAWPVRRGSTDRRPLFERADVRVLTVVAGYTGSGKTETGKLLAQATGWALIDKDTITRAIVESLLARINGDPHDRQTRDYLTQVRPLEYECLMRTGWENVECGTSTILSAPFPREIGDANWVGSVRLTVGSSRVSAPACATSGCVRAAVAEAGRPFPDRLPELVSAGGAPEGIRSRPAGSVGEYPVGAGWQGEWDRGQAIDALGVERLRLAVGGELLVGLAAEMVRVQAPVLSVVHERDREAAGVTDQIGGDQDDRSQPGAVGVTEPADQVSEARVVPEDRLTASVHPQHAGWPGERAPHQRDPPVLPQMRDGFRVAATEVQEGHGPFVEHGE